MPASFSTGVYVESRPTAVFDALSNLDAARQWMPNFVRMEKLTSGPFGVGTEWRETRKMFGKEATEHFRVTRFDPPSRMDIVVDGAKGSSKRGEYHFVFELLPERTGTNVELSGDVQMPGIWGLVSRFMIGTFKKACHKDLEALKAHIERSAAADVGR